LLTVYTLVPAVILIVWVLLMKWVSVLYPRMDAYVNAQGRAAHSHSRMRLAWLRFVQLILVVPTQRALTWWTTTSFGSKFSSQSSETVGPAVTSSRDDVELILTPSG